MKLIRPQDLSSPRFWLFLWGGLGAAFILYVIGAAVVQSFAPGGGQRHDQIAAKPLRDQALLTGEMSKFLFADRERRAPKASFTSAAGETTLADFKGRAVLVNLWATWCAPCLRELPSLDALQEKLGGDAFEVVAIAADPKGRTAAQAYLDKLQIRHLSLNTDERIAFASAVGGSAALPVSILYDRNGVEVGRLIGEANWSSPEAEALVRRAAGL